MNLRGVANNLTRAVNPNVVGLWQAYAAPVTNPDGTVTPTYAAPVAIDLQMQALTQNDIYQLDGLNLQGVHTKVYANTTGVSAINRATGKGGDLISFAGRKWLAALVFEEWVQDGWIALGLTEQLDAPVLGLAP